MYAFEKQFIGYDIRIHGVLPQKFLLQIISYFLVCLDVIFIYHVFKEKDKLFTV